MRLFIILSICIALTYARRSESVSLKKCPRQGPNLVPCILERVESMRPRLKMGIPEINVPRLEPFKIRELKLDAKLPGLVLKGEATNVVAHGASNFQIKKLKLDPSMNNYFFEIHVVIPKLEVMADYDSTGSKVLLMEVSGTGQFQGIFTGVSAVVSGNGHAIMKDGLEYVKIDDVTANIRFGSGSLHVDPDSDSSKAKLAAQFIEKGSEMLLSQLAPVIDKAAAPIIKRYINKILNVVPLNDILI